MKNKKILKMTEKEEERLGKIFSLLRKRESIIIADKKMRFNQTELRMLSEIISASYEGKRLISTQLAKRLGITRSAVSQIVNRLEEAGVVKRVADAVDRKIAYIEVTDETMETYNADIQACGLFVGKVVRKFGEEKFEEMYSLIEEFIGLIEEEKAQVTPSKKRKKKC